MPFTALEQKADTAQNTGDRISEWIFRKYIGEATVWKPKPIILKELDSWERKELFLNSQILALCIISKA